jgi:signal peptidase I
MKSREYILLAVGAVLIILFVAVNVLPHAGVFINGVDTGSMSPGLDEGSLAIAKKVDPASLKVGDVIVFRSPTAGQNDIYRRITAIASTNPRAFTTKGDNLTAPDPNAVPAGNVVGVVTFSMPALGFVPQFLKTSIGLAICLILPCLVILAITARSLWHEIIRVVKERISKEDEE